MVGSAVTWIALNGDIFARLVISTFSWWPLPVAATAVLSIALWTLSAIRGYDGLEFISYVGVPAALIMSIAGVVAVARTAEGFKAVLDYVPVAEMSFSAGTASVIGG